MTDESDTRIDTVIPAHDRRRPRNAPITSIVFDHRRRRPRIRRVDEVVDV
jgi:hypothetical protein